MSKQTCKKSFIGFMVLTIFLWPLNPILSSPAMDKIASDDGMLLRKLKVEQLKKTRQLKGVDSKKKTRTFSADESLKKLADVKQLEKPSYVEGEVLVKFKERKINLEYSSGRRDAKTFATSKKLEKKEDIRKSNISVLKIKDSKTVEEKIDDLKNDPRVEYVQPNYQYYPLMVNSNLWGLHNTGQTVNTVLGTEDADIDAPEAWEISEGEGSNIIVAVIDSGVAYNHPDLADNMWNGTNCKDENGNILNGCQHGYDYQDDDKIPLPTSSSHGTHIAGTIGAVENDSGIIGVAPNVKIMALKVAFTTDQILMAIDFAEINGAKVINASWGSKYGNNTCVGAWDSDYNTTFDKHLYDAIHDFSGIFVAAAGNSSKNHDLTNYFNTPSDYGATTACWDALDNIISVAATDQNDELADEGYWGSDYGVNSVDVGAPGVNIYSTIADIVLLDETFESVAPPNVPSGWTKEGIPNYWGTYDLGGAKVLYGDYANHFPYASDVDTIINSSAINLAESTSAKIDFVTVCDTELYSPQWDYMALEISNGGTFTEILRWNEHSFIGDFDFEYIPLTNSSYVHFVGVLPSEYLTSNFNFRLRWATDDLLNNYAGCLIDNFQITKYTDGSDEKYAYYQGTSMAAPHVAGLAALIWGYDSELSYSQVKDVILETGDDLSSLAGKIATGKRINAHKALLSLTAPVILESFPVDDVTEISTSTIPYLQFSKPLDPITVIAGNIELRKYAESSGDSIPVLATLSLEDSDTKVVFDLDENLDYETQYYFYADAGVLDIYGNQIESENRWLHEDRASHEFTTELVPNSPPVLDFIGNKSVVENGSLEFTISATDSNIGDTLIYSASNLPSGASFDINTKTFFWTPTNEQIGTYINIHFEVSDSKETDFEDITITVTEIPDTTPPVIVEKNPVQTPTKDNTPEYTFSSDEAGTITYGGPCSSLTTIADIGDNEIIFSELVDGTYDNCTIMVTDASENDSNILAVYSFTIDTTSPTAEETTAITTPTNNTTPDIVITVEDGASWEIKNGDDSLNTGTGIGAEQTITLPELTEGIYNLILIATDEAENTTTVNLSEFEIDLSVSPISLSTLPNNPTNKITADITVSGDDIIFYKYKLDSADYGEEISIDTNIILSDLSEGEHTLSVKGRDGAGNWSKEILETWTIDLTVPIATIAYNVTDLTNTDVVATLEPSESITVTNNENNLTYTFIENGEFIFEFTDIAGNIGSAVATVDNIDKVIPEITLLGKNPVNLKVGDTYEEAGATSIDDVDGDITASIVTVNQVDTTATGTYMVTYNVSDKAGNQADEVIRTVNVGDVFSPDAVDNLSISNVKNHTLKLNWTATGDDGNTGTASSYDIRYSTTEITNDNFDSAIQISSPSAPTPKEVGTKQSVEVNGLNQGTKYYFAMKVSDEVPNESGISNVVSVKTNTPRSSGGGGGSYTPPADKTPPAQPKHFKADRENEKIILTWSNPKDSDFNKVLIVKSEELITSNLSIDDLKNKGKTIYEGNNEQYNDSDVDNDTVYYYAITAYDKKLNYTKLIILETRPKINGQKTAQNSNGKVAVLGVETSYRTIQINNILSEAGYIYSGDSDSSAKNRKKQRDENEETETHNKYVARLVKGINGLIESNIRAFTNFILYSTETTDILGAGERAGVINSYKSAFGKLPTTESEWQDLIKIANGRWTTERSETAENNAKKEFKKVYKRDANMENPNDNAAVTIIAYGLRPNSRNLNSEKAGIKSFKHIYGYNPENATDWDIVRAIAYSGAIR